MKSSGHQISNSTSRGFDDTTLGAMSSRASRGRSATKKDALYLKRLCANYAKGGSESAHARLLEKIRRGDLLDRESLRVGLQIIKRVAVYRRKKEAWGQIRRKMLEEQLKESKSYLQ